MTHQCPACQRTFDEPGFCPFDGKQLVESNIAQRPTVFSEIMAAQSGPITIADPLPTPTELDVREPTNKLKAVSAAQQSTQQIIESFREHTSEYDRLVGETLDGRYYIQRKIGEGGMGVVYSAKHAVIERPLAIKVLKREAMRDTATIKRFVQEARAASRIGHPNIVDVTDFGTTPEGMTYSVMEFVDGITLSRAIKDHAPLPPERSIRIVTQIARALGAAHAKGIVHRDLKPENVFLTARDGRPDFVKIVDFGIAKVQPLEGADPNAPRLTRAGSVFGTPEYMAPEQAAGRSDTDGRVDIYALGTILYEMTCGRTPHKSDSMVRTIAMQMLDPITPPSQVHPDLAVPKALELVIMKALAKKRDDRYQTMAEVVIALDRVVSELKHPAATLSLPPVPPGADPLPPTSPGRPKGETRPLHEPEFVTQGPVGSLPTPAYEEPPPEPRRWPIAAISVVLLVAGAGAVWLTMRQPPAAAPRDAGIAMIARADAALVIDELDDAGQLHTDARAIAYVPDDGGTRTHDARLPLPGEHPGMVTVEVLTRPAEANVFVGLTFYGTSGTHLTQPYGTKLPIECRAPHYKGHVQVVFDGSRDSVMCTAVRLKMCVDGLKNPYDDCEPKPDAGP
jgi:serine/threonine protein kinase